MNCLEHSICNIIYICVMIWFLYPSLVACPFLGFCSAFTLKIFFCWSLACGFRGHIIALVFGAIIFFILLQDFRFHAYLNKKSFWWKCHQWHAMFHTSSLLNATILGTLVFCYQNCSDLLWEQIVLVIEKNFWNSRLKAENLQNFWDH